MFALLFLKYKNFIFFTLKKLVKVISCKSRNYIIRWHISTSIKVILAPTLIVSEILTCKNVSLKDLVKVTEYNFSNDTVPFQMSKCTKCTYLANSYRFRDIRI